MKIEHILKFKISVIIFFFALNLYSQSIIPFLPRKEYKEPIRGDFALIGNSNLKPVNNSAFINGNEIMQWIDVDADSNTSNSSSATLQFPIGTSNKDCTEIEYAGIYWTGRCDLAYSPITFQYKDKNFDKRQIKLKGEKDSDYTLITTKEDNINFPSGNFENLYIGYADITDFVKKRGEVEYTVADIALKEEDGTNIGFFGGWAMVVVYKNPNLKPRTIHLFDGYSFMSTDNGEYLNFDLNIDGFKTIPSGLVNASLGVFAAEGDLNVENDFFKIQNTKGDLIDLSHSLNQTDNFFNSSINTGDNLRNPENINNFGVDIAKFDIPNTGNSLISNNQTSIKFNYGSSQDFYTIGFIGFSVEVFNPIAYSSIAIKSIDGLPVSTLNPKVVPGQEIEYEIEIYNGGNESLKDLKLNFPFSYNLNYVPNSAKVDLIFDPTYKNYSINYNQTPNDNGILNLSIDELPIPSNRSTILAKFTFKSKVTTDCNILKSSNCNNKVNLIGSIQGTGSISGTNILNDSNIGFEKNLCSLIPIKGSSSIELNIDDYNSTNCTRILGKKELTFCENETIDFLTIRNLFSPTTRIFNEFPVKPTSIEFTDFNPFPKKIGTSTYYAVFPGANSCYSEVIITIYEFPDKTIINSPTEICLGEELIYLISGVKGSEISCSLNDQPSTSEIINSDGKLIIKVKAEGLSQKLTIISAKNGTCLVKIDKTITVKVLNLTTSSIAGESVFCEGLIKNFEVDASENTGLGTLDSNYTWEILENTFSGIISKNGSTNKISIDWKNTPIGTYNLKVTETNSMCKSEKSLKITIKRLPAIEIDDFICPNGKLTFDAGIGYDSYLWFDSENKIIGKNQELTVFKAGNYTLEVVKGECKLTQKVNAFPVNFPKFNIEVTEDNTLIIQTDENSSFLYQLEDLNGLILKNWQPSNTFFRIPSGDYYLKIQTQNGTCIEKLKITVLNIFNTLTPNGDSKNDIWDLSQLNDYKNAVVKVFDRYGKLITTLDSTNNYNWNGNYLDRNLPSGAYWYEIFLENRIITGYILLKNN